MEELKHARGAGRRAVALRWRSQFRAMASARGGAGCLMAMRDDLENLPNLEQFADDVEALVNELAFLARRRRGDSGALPSHDEAAESEVALGQPKPSFPAIRRF